MLSSISAQDASFILVCTSARSRGNHLQKGALVKRRAPRIVAPELDGFGEVDETSGRLQLARAITNSEVPLAARVMVNRIWRWHFGKAIVASTENFGSSGAKPTHPGLLDYLARYFVQNNWDIKKLHRHIMESNTYRMGFHFDQESSDRDQENRWYWRSTPRRLEAEAIRDSLLMMSGELDRGNQRGVLDGITTLSPSPEALKRNREIYESSLHRSVYLPIVRTNVYQLFSLFDFLFIRTTKRQKYFPKPEWQLKNTDQTSSSEQAQNPAW